MTYATAIAARHTGTGQITSLDMAALAGRVALSAIFILSGLSKLADPAGTIGYIQSVGLPVPQLAFLLAVAIEIVGGVVLIAGLRTRLVTAALATFSRSEEHTSELQSLMRNSYAVFCLKKKNHKQHVNVKAFNLLQVY